MFDTFFLVRHSQNETKRNSPMRQQRWNYIRSDWSQVETNDTSRCWYLHEGLTFLTQCYLFFFFQYEFNTPFFVFLIFFFLIFFFFQLCFGIQLSQKDVSKLNHKNFKHVEHIFEPSTVYYLPRISRPSDIINFMHVNEWRRKKYLFLLRPNGDLTHNQILSFFLSVRNVMELVTITSQTQRSGFGFFYKTSWIFSFHIFESSQTQMSNHFGHQN